MNNVDGEHFTPAYTDKMELDVVLYSNDNNDNNFHADGSGNVCTVDEHDAASNARDVHIKTDNRGVLDTAEVLAYNEKCIR